MNCKHHPKASNPPPSGENSWKRTRAFKSFEYMKVQIIRVCIHIFPSGTKLASHRLDEIATINYQGYHAVVHSFNICNYKDM